MSLRIHSPKTPADADSKSPRRWSMPGLPKNPGTRKALAILFFLGALGLAVVQYVRHASAPPQETEEAKILLYQTDQRRLVAVSPKHVPGVDHLTASLTLFARTARHTPPRAGMTLGELEDAGLFPAWLYKVDPATRQGMYALPDQPDAWIGAGDPKFKTWMESRMQEVRKRVGNHPVPLTL